MDARTNPGFSLDALEIWKTRQISHGARRASRRTSEHWFEIWRKFAQDQMERVRDARKYKSLSV
jgi:hypothetical protein